MPVKKGIGSKLKLAVTLLLSWVCCQAIQAAPAFVQVSTGNSTLAVTTQSVSLGSLPTVGNVVVVAVSLGNIDTISTVTDNQGNAYVQVRQQTSIASNVDQASLWCAEVGTSSGTFTVTSTTVLTAFASVYALEYSGVSCLADKTGSAFGNTSPYSCGSFTTRQAVALLVSTINTSAGGTSLTFTQPSGFTIRAQTPNGTLNQAGAVADNIVSSTNTFTPVWSVSSNASASCVTGVVYPVASGGGGAFSFGVTQ